MVNLMQASRYRAVWLLASNADSWSAITDDEPSNPMPLTNFSVRKTNPVDKNRLRSSGSFKFGTGKDSKEALVVIVSPSN